MGCDIHLFVEKRVGTRWRQFQRTVEAAQGDYKFTEDYYALDDRNYNAFAILADVRNGVGFAGVVTGERFQPIAPPKGFPEDVDYGTREDKETWEGDGHSHSYLTLRELEEFPHWKKTRKQYGVVPISVAHETPTGRAPQGGYCGGITGPGIVTLTYDEYLAAMRDGSYQKLDPNRTYVQLQWEQTYAESAGRYYSVMIPRLRELAQGDPDSVRIVFWFDN